MAPITSTAGAAAARPAVTAEAAPIARPASSRGRRRRVGRRWPVARVAVRRAVARQVRRDHPPLRTRHKHSVSKVRLQTADESIGCESLACKAASLLAKHWCALLD